MNIYAFLTESIKIRNLIFSPIALIAGSLDKLFLLEVMEIVDTSFKALGAQSIFFIDMPFILAFKTFALNLFLIDLSEVVFIIFENALFGVDVFVDFDDVVMVLEEEEMDLSDGIVNVLVHVLGDIVLSNFIDIGLNLEHSAA